MPATQSSKLIEIGFTIPAPSTRFHRTDFRAALQAARSPRPAAKLGNMARIAAKHV
jgi:hypothetical protein